MIDERTVAHQFDLWNAALQTGNPGTVRALYASDAVLVPTMSNRIRRTPAEIEDYFAHFLLKRPRGEIRQHNIRAFGDLAINSGIYVFELTTDQGVVELPCRFTFVYRKDGEVWKIIEHHSSVMPE